MKNRYQRLFGYCVFIIFLSLGTIISKAQTSPASSPPSDDNQFWNENQLVKRLTTDKDLVIIGGIRMGRNFERPVEERIGAGVAFKINKYLTLMPTYLYLDFQPYAGLRISEHRIVMNATAKFAAGKFTFTDRNLVERRARHSQRDFTVYRNRLQIDHPAQIGSFKFKPFIADEIWYSRQSNAAGQFGWFRNRISAGILKQITENFYGEFFYLRQNDGRSRPGNVHAIGTLFRYTL